MIISKKQRRMRRAIKARAHIRNLAAARLSVHRTPNHIYAQVTDAEGAKVIAAASTLQKAVREGLKGTGNVAAAKAVGRAIAERSNQPRRRRIRTPNSRSMSAFAICSVG